MPGFERTAPVFRDEPAPGYGDTFCSLKDVFEAIVCDESDPPPNPNLTQPNPNLTQPNPNLTQPNPNLTLT